MPARRVLRLGGALASVLLGLAMIASTLFLNYRTEASSEGEELPVPAEAVPDVVLRYTLIAAPLAEATGARLAAPALTLEAPPTMIALPAASGPEAPPEIIAPATAVPSPEPEIAEAAQPTTVTGSDVEQASQESTQPPQTEETAVPTMPPSTATPPPSPTLMASPTPETTSTPEPTAVVAEAPDDEQAAAPPAAAVAGGPEGALQIIDGVNLTFYDCAVDGFCGAMYNGEQVYEGAAACSWDLPIGTEFYILGDPTGRLYVCKDRGLLANTWIDVFWYYPEDGYAWQAVVGRYGSIAIMSMP